MQADWVVERLLSLYFVPLSKVNMLADACRLKAVSMGHLTFILVCEQSLALDIKFVANISIGLIL